MNFFARLFGRKKTATPTENTPPIQVPCRADLWCRKRTSISTMLDPDLYALYMTGDDRIDEDWVVQSNPPCSFKAEFKEGCDTLLELLQVDPGLHATKGWLTFVPPNETSEEARGSYRKKLQVIVRTAERELKTGI
jgi:hypothetical protein